MRSKIWPGSGSKHERIDLSIRMSTLPNRKTCFLSCALAFWSKPVPPITRSRHPQNPATPLEQSLSTHSVHNLFRCCVSIVPCPNAPSFLTCLRPASRLPGPPASSSVGEREHARCDFKCWLAGGTCAIPAFFQIRVGPSVGLAPRGVFGPDPGTKTWLPFLKTPTRQPLFPPLNLLSSAITTIMASAKIVEASANFPKEAGRTFQYGTAGVRILPSLAILNHSPMHYSFV